MRLAAGNWNRIGSNELDEQSSEIINEFNAGNSEIICVEHVEEIECVISAAVYGSKGINFVTNKDWIH